MKKKILAAVLAALLLVGLGAFAMIRRSQNLVANAQPLRIMIDGTRYVINGSVESRPDAAPDGTIQEILAWGDFPKEDGQANFGTAGMPYWHIGDKIVVESSMYYVFAESK